MAELYDASREEEHDLDSPFHPDNVQQYTLLTLLQCRELLGGILQGVNPAGYQQIRTAHRAGRLLLEPPRLLPQSEEEDASADE